ncbi:MAG: 50S ribosomal protein L24 [Firmicutes bacterium]|nr:50S ribosomal protein L24 [Bacillota bacterium]
MRPHVKKGDTVIVLWGVDKDRRGKVLRVLAGESRVIVEGANEVKRHTKPTQLAPQGGIIKKAAPMPLSKVMLVCPKCNKPTRIGRKRTQDGGCVRVCKECGRDIDN